MSTQIHWVQKLKLTAIFGLVFIMVIIPVAPAFADQQPAATDIPPVQTPADSTATQPDQSISALAPVTTGPDQTTDTQTTANTTSNSSDQNTSDAVQSDPLPQDKRFDTSKKTNLKVDESSGSLNYLVPIVVPPGRNNLQPDLALQYNSQTSEEGSQFGHGWAINIPYIERINRYGGENLYSTNIFNSSLSGELVAAGGTSFISKVDNGEFLSYTFSNNQWVVKDKQGLTYKFGLTVGSRQDDPSDSTKVYKWMLEELSDTNGNIIVYQYFKSNGQIYPYKINYDINGADNGIFEIEFLREARTDTVTSYKSTFAAITDQRINEIQVKISGNWIRKYSLQYSNGDNGKRSLLESVTESGKDEFGVVTTLPASQFDYQVATTAGNPWQADDAHPFPVDLRRAQLGDVNGDGLVDIVYSTKPDQQPVDARTYLNNGDGTWTLNSQYTAPLAFYEEAPTSNPIDMGVRLVDVNGDGLVDILYRNSQLVGTWLNNGNGWTQQTNVWQSPLPFASGPYGGDQSLFADIADINCDGLPDILTARQAPMSQDIIDAVYINNGLNGWIDETNIWNVPVDLRWGTELTDINGDGCADIFQSYSTNSIPAEGIYYSNGKNGWVIDGSNLPPTIFYNRDSSPADPGSRLIDANGDGLVDVLKSNDCGQSESYLNEASNWLNSQGVWNSPIVFVSCRTPVDQGVRSIDLNGDGMQDIIQTYVDNNGLQSVIKINIRQKADLLSKITLPSGGISTVAYKSTPQYKNGTNSLNPNLSSALMVVDSTTTNDGVNPNIVQNYSYEGGKYYYNNPTDKKFAGFSKITSTDAVGNKTLTFYHQGDATDVAHGEFDDHFSKIGKPYRIEQRDSNGNLFSVTTNKWDRFDLGNSANFVKLVNTLTMTYDGDGTHRDSAEEYSYNNSTGNQISKIEYGEVTGNDTGIFIDNIGTDKFTTTTSYATGSTFGVAGLPSQKTVTDQNNNKVSESKYLYDLLPFGSVDKGNQTQQQDWITSTTYATKNNTYNSYGLVTQSTDPDNNAIDYTYDSFNLYPATVTQHNGATNFVTSYTYDYSLGKPKQITDPNGGVMQYTFDGLDRVTEEKQTDPAAPTQLQSKTIYQYTDTANNVSVKKSSNLDGNNIVDDYTYYDGLGRAIQERTETEDANQFIVKDTKYNNRGLVDSESLPYFNAGSAKTSPTTTNSLYVTTGYDTIGRVSSITNNLGTTSTTYQDWKQTITDADGKVKDLYKDAYDRLIRVDEHNGASIYTTTYQYNGNGNLTKLTDALGNVRNFTYDGLGRRLTAEDLHAPTDTTFGVWSYGYDNAGNLTSRLDANGQNTIYGYDGLNRVKTEDYRGQKGIEVTYNYDSCPNGLTRLCNVASDVMHRNEEYDKLGQLTKETKWFNGVNYVTNYDYDRQGNQTRIVNPDLSEVKYIYNAGGQQEQVQRKENGDANYTAVITDMDYAPTGSMTFLQYASGANITNTYDPTKLYRLSNKITLLPLTGGGNKKAQDLTYTYDAVGNIITIVDASDFTPKTVTYGYDDLHRLTSAVATGGSSYNLSYTYDAIGNILTKSDEGTYTYGGNQGTSYANPHAVTSVSNDGFTSTLTYDKNGNMLTDDLYTYIWDYNNRMKESDLQGIIAHTDTYYYDDTGSRVSQLNMIGGVVSPNYYPSPFYNTDGISPQKHILAAGNSVATIKGTGASAALTQLHTDHLGSVVETSIPGTNPSQGGLAETLDYFPFGSIRQDTVAQGQTEQRKYIGKEYDSDTNLSYLEARYYDGSLGRFLSEDPQFLSVSFDPIDPQSFNSYSYARNNPIGYADPTGLSFTSWVKDKYNEAKAAVTNTYSNAKAEVKQTAQVVNNTYQNTKQKVDKFVNHPTVVKTVDTANALNLVVVGALSFPETGDPSMVEEGVNNLEEEFPGIEKTVINEEKNYVTKYDDVIPPDRQQHILEGNASGGGHRAGTGLGKTEFPASWSDQKIFNGILNVATDPRGNWIYQPLKQTYSVTGNYDGVEIQAIIDRSKSFIVTGYPTH